MSQIEHNESARLNVLYNSKLLDTPSSIVLNTLLKMAQKIFGVNIVLVTLVDEKRQWFKAKVGLDISETPRDISFCTHTIEQDMPMIIADTVLDERFVNNPLVTEYPNIRFYSGVPIHSSAGYKLGSFCLIHDTPKLLSEEQIELQIKFAKLVELELISLSLSVTTDQPSANQVNHSVLKAQHVFLDTDDEHLTFKTLLDDLLALTESSFGYIAEVKYRNSENERHQFLKMKSITNIAWNKQTNERYKQYENDGLEFHDLDNLLGVSLTSGKNTIVNDFKGDTRVKGLPKGHPDIVNYCAIPIRSGNTVIGQIGLANREKDYSEDFISAIEAITLTVGVLIERARLLLERETYTRKLFDAAHVDEITGLPNRRSLSKYLESLINHHGTSDTFVICFFDLDGFKLVNDSHGHSQGDKLLALVAKRLEGMIRNDDFIARVSGDEFVIVLRQANSDIYQRILNAINRPFQLSHGSVKVSASMGVSRYPDDSKDIGQLLRYADQAMYIAKHTGKNQVIQFDASLHRERQRKTEVIQAVITALKNDDIKPYLQPKFAVTDKRILGFELLSRWQHKEKGVLTPDSFLPDIQETHAQVIFDDYMFDQVPDILSQLHDIDDQFTLNINVSSEYFNSQEFILRIEKLAMELPEKVSFLILEIVESTALGELESAIERLNYCKRLGYLISLDDFGTSFSSLTYFRTLPADEVKIDRSFIADILSDPHDVAIIKAIISMATAFSRTVVAEGVESEAQLELLKSFGCQSAQGFFFAKPMPIAELADFCAARK